MKVAELIDDLETGDRTMEHLKKPSQPEPESVTFSGLAQAAMQAGIGMTGSSLASMLGQQQSMNQFANQQNALGFGQSLIGRANSGPLVGNGGF